MVSHVPPPGARHASLFGLAPFVVAVLSLVAVGVAGGVWFPPLVAGAVPRWVFWLWGCVVSALSRCVGFVPVVSVALRSARCRVVMPQEFLP